MTRNEPLRAGVVGWPVSHSKSPRMHGEWLRRSGVDGTYEAVGAEPGRFEATIRELVEAGWRGVNVTLPHKEAALALADEATERAASIGAANTLVFGSDGRVAADNTDGFGFIANIDDRAPGRWKRGEPATILGAGGASRAIIRAVLDEGAPEVRLVNRTRARAEALRAAFGDRVAVFDWSDAARAIGGSSLIVNTTSLGMEGQPPLELDFGNADPAAVSTDIVYTPLWTPFLRSAAEAGLATVDGLGMLLHQGRPGFEAWFGAKPMVDHALREIMLAP